MAGTIERFTTAVVRVLSFTGRGGILLVATHRLVVGHISLMMHGPEKPDIVAQARFGGARGR